jgi:hypothetical protein
MRSVKWSIEGWFLGIVTTVAGLVGAIAHGQEKTVRFSSETFNPSGAELEFYLKKPNLVDDYKLLKEFMLRSKVRSPETFKFEDLKKFRDWMKSEGKSLRGSNVSDPNCNC